ncbi:HD domain-containing protein [Pseudomonas citronellolis]|uniref:HD domain-containing protein n=1 Tax=Pseudomonas citronellolis TaxID=53408 RepID=UPI0023E3E229|nr:HD domain-containing protein [Pseudomonas citronellolis]MDF3933744.1 HD domain-containing protein [Pseudomonas citronellolis]
MTLAIDGVKVPDSQLAREITEMVRDNATPLLFHHSSRVYYWGALSGARQGLTYDAELLYAGAMFHDMGLMPRYCSQCERFEVDGADCAAEFLRGHGIAERDVETVWTAIALHTTPGIPRHMRAEIALVTAGVEMDVLGMQYEAFPAAVRDAVVAAHPRGDAFKQAIIDTFYQGIKDKPQTTFGNVKADVLALKDAQFERGNFCEVILGSAWPS